MLAASWLDIDDILYEKTPSSSELYSALRSVPHRS